MNREHESIGTRSERRGNGRMAVVPERSARRGFWNDIRVTSSGFFYSDNPDVFLLSPGHTVNLIAYGLADGYAAGINEERSRWGIYESSSVVKKAWFRRSPTVQKKVLGLLDAELSSIHPEHTQALISKATHHDPSGHLMDSLTRTLNQQIAVGYALSQSTLMLLYAAESAGTDLSLLYKDWRTGILYTDSLTNNVHRIMDTLSFSPVAARVAEKVTV